MNQLVARAIKGVLAGTLLVVCLYVAMAYMISLEEQAYYSGPPKGYDNDFLGMGWVILFFLALPVVLMITGAVAARKIAAEGVKDVIKASALAGILLAIPAIMIAFGMLLLLTTLSVSNPGSLTGSDLPKALIGNILCCSPIIFVVILFALFSVFGGLLYAFFASAGLDKRDYLTGIMTGCLCGAVPFLVYLYSYYSGEGFYSIVRTNNYQFLVFMTTALLSGAVVAIIRRDRSELTGRKAFSSLLSGTVTGIIAAIGYHAIHFLKYQAVSLDLFSLLIFVPDGAILGVLGGVLGTVIARGMVRALGYRPSGEYPGRLFLASVGTGVVIGLCMALINVLPAIIPMLIDLAAFLGFRGDLYPLISLAEGCQGFLITILLALLAGVLAVLICGVKKLKEGVIASCMAGMVACTFSFAGEAIRAVMNELFIPGMYSYQPIEEATLNTVTSGAFQILQCAPFKLIFMTGVAMTGGIMVTAWVLKKTK